MTNTHAIPTVTVVEILPTRIWIEDDICGGRHVMLQHEGMEPFCYASFHYSYAYTSNSGTWAAATELAKSLGAVEPIERRQRPIEFTKWPEGAAFIDMQGNFFDARARPLADQNAAVSEQAAPPASAKARWLDEVIALAVEVDHFAAEEGESAKVEELREKLARLLMNPPKEQA